MSRNLYLFFILLLASQCKAYAQSPDTAVVRLAVAGTSHGHVAWMLGKKDKTKVVVVGIYEPDTALIQKQIRNFKLPASLFYTDLNKMLDAVKPEAVVAFGSIFQHLAVVEACAPRRIHVMVEKPLAVSVEHASRMESLAKKFGILLLTNYETSWYASTERAYRLAVDSHYAGAIRRVVFHHGHEGPKEIGVSPEFFNWLTDPVQNGAGALVDFGCYGANIMTYLTQGERPVAVTAVTRRFKPAIYPKVDDDATIIVEYPDAEAVIQASWNWPFSRKDMEIYGVTGYILAPDKNTLRRKNKSEKDEQTEQLQPSDLGVYDDPFAYFADVIRKRITVPDHGLYSLSNNLLVVRILEAARQSAATGKRVVIR